MQTMDPTHMSPRRTVRRMLAALCMVFLPALAWAAPFAYVTNLVDDTVSVIDTATHTVVTTIGVGSSPDAVSVNSAGTRVYIANSGGDSISVIDTSTNTVVATVALSVNSYPKGIVVNAAGTRVYVANNNNSTVSVIDTTSNAVVATVPVGSYPWGITVNAAGTRVYVANYLDDTVSVIDTATNLVVGVPIAVGLGPLGIAINPAGTRLYVGNSLEDVNPAHEGTVSVVDTGSNAVIATVTVGEDPYGIAVSPNGSRIYVSNCCAQSVSVIEATGNTVVATVSVGTYPRGISITPDGTRVYVVNDGDDNVSVIDTATNTVVGTQVMVGAQPQGFGNFIGPGAVVPDPPAPPAPIDPIPTLPPLPGVLGIGTQPTVLDLGAGKGPEMIDCLMATVRKLFGDDATYLGQNANGIAQISISGNRVVAFYALKASTDPGLGEGIHLTSSNVLNVGTGCGNFNVTPAMHSLVELGAVLNGMGLTASIGTQGVMTLTVGDTVYVMRPDYITRLAVPSVLQAPSMVRSADGVYRFTDSAGNVQMLLPAFLDTDALAVQATALQGGWVSIQTDGTAVFTAFSGQQFLLTPDLALSRVAPENASLLLWRDGANHYQFRGNTILMSQGVGVLAR